LDPDFGVAIPQSLDTVEQNPEIVRKYYINKLYRDENVTEDKIVDIYGKDGNIIYTPPTIGNVGYVDCNWKKVSMERASYILKWIIPIFLIIPFICLKKRNLPLNQK